MENHFSLRELLEVVWKHARKIVLVALIAAILTAGISLLLPNIYQATTLFYAASPDLSAPPPINTSNNRIQVYGNDYDIDRLISIAESQELIDNIITKFNLYEHYELDSTLEKARYRCREKLIGNYRVNKTKYGGISLTVEDQDAQLAADMANSARDRVSELAQNIIKNSQRKTLDAYLSNINDKSENLSQLNDSLKRQKAFFEIIDLGSQAEVLATNQAEVSLSLNEKLGALEKMQSLGLPRDSINQVRAKVAGLRNKKALIDKQLSKFNDGAATVRSLESEIGIINGQLGILKERYSQLNAAFMAPFTSLHLIEKAQKPLVKAKPRRSLLVIGAAGLATALMILLIVIRHSIDPDHGKDN